MNKVLLTLALTLFLAGCDFENPGGVLASNQIPASVLDFVDEENILDDEYIKSVEDGNDSENPQFNEFQNQYENTIY